MTYRLPVLNPKQLEFCLSVRDKNDTYMLGGYGLGKTMANVYAIYKCAFDWNKGFNGALLGPSIGNLKKNFIVEWKKFIPRPLYKIVYGDNPHIKCFHAGHEPTYIFLLSAKSGDRIEGSNVAFVSVEEIQIISRSQVETLNARARLKGTYCRKFGTGLPISGTWLDFEFNHKKNLQEYGGKYNWIRGNALDNQDNIKEGYLEDLKGSMDKATFEQKGLGKFSKQTGIIYPEFEQGIHVTECTLPNSAIISQDYNVDNYTSLFLGWNGREIVVTHEVIGGSRFQEHLEMVDACRLDISPAFGKERFVVTGDASSRARDNSGYNVQQRILDNGWQIFFPRRNPEIDTRDSTVKFCLMSADHKSIVKIHPRCEQLIYALSNIKYKNRKTSGLDHVIDAFGYGVMYLVAKYGILLEKKQEAKKRTKKPQYRYNGVSVWQ